MNLAALHTWLVNENGYAGSLRSIQCFVSETYPPPPRRARRRVETPRGAQAQVDWAEFPGLVIAGELRTLHAFHMVLSHSRQDAIVWMANENQLSWLAGHNGAFRRLGGIPAVVRVDNAKTAVARGAGCWGTLNETYRRYAMTVCFHIDVCAPYSPEHKGKVERVVRTQRWEQDPQRQPWDSLEELQSHTDATLAEAAHRRRCPATGTSVYEAWQAERAFLAALPTLPETFDLVATRRVAKDALVAFEGRQYSVPFTWLGKTVELRGTSSRVQILADTRIIAELPRHTAARLVIDPAHYEGPGTRFVQPPTPLGRLGQRLQELAFPSCQSSCRPDRSVTLGA